MISGEASVNQTCVALLDGKSSGIRAQKLLVVTDLFGTIQPQKALPFVASPNALASLAIP